MQPRLHPPRAILFDVGNTLLAERRFDLEAGIAAVVGERREVVALAEAFRADVADSHRRQSEPLLAQWLCDRVPDLASIGITAVEDAVWQAVVTLVPQPGVKNVLAALAADSVGLAAVSNATFTGRVLHGELARHGLAHYLRFVVTSADVRSRKPATPLFKAAVGRLGVSAADAWFVGDTREEDVAGALAAGLQPIWLSRQASQAATDQIPLVQDWRGFAALYANVRPSAG